MNGENNNQNNQNNGFSSIPLGNMQNSGINNTPIPPVDASTSNAVEEPMETLDGPVLSSVNPIPTPSNNVAEPAVPVNPIPPVDPVPTISNDIPEVISSAPVFNDIGTIPPVPNTPVASSFDAPDVKIKKSGGSNKIIFVLIVVLALTAVGVGVYILLALTNEPKVVLKNLKIEVGSEVSTNKNDYAAFSGKIDSSACSLDTSKITDTSKLNQQYEFSVTCEGVVYHGKATIVDTVKPEAELKEVTTMLNNTVKPEDFITECKDETKCTYTFKDPVKVAEYVKKEGSYHADIIIKDEAGNETEVTGVLKVTNVITPSISLKCTKTTDGVLETNRFGLDGSTFTKVTLRSYTFNLSDTEYASLKEQNSGSAEVTYKNVTGAPKFNDEDKTLVITKNVSYEDLNTEVGTTVPTGHGELKELYESKGYVCQIGY